MTITDVTDLILSTMATMCPPAAPPVFHECPNCGAQMESDAWSGGGCPECDHWDAPIDADWECDCEDCMAQRDHS
jgi:Zn finger protein HypA/HybF involved in hydrogenase expression